MSKSADLARLIQERAGSEPVELGIILGSGLGHLAEEVEGVSIPFNELPGFPVGTVSGHNKKLVIGTLEGVRVAVFGGRAHYYEEGNASVMRLPLEVLKALGATAIIATNAAGSLRNDMPTGSIMQISDHINFSGTNPLIGEPTDARFVPMTDAYDKDISEGLMAAAGQAGVQMHTGTYIWFSGPSFETPAEIRMARLLGADAVGMSTVPEVILARFLGLKAAAISTITNMGAGMSTEQLSHEHTKEMAPIGAAKLEKVLRAYLRQRCAS